MKYDDFFENQKLYKSIADEINDNFGLKSTFRDALDQVTSVANHQELLEIATAYDRYSPPGSEFTPALLAAQSIQERVSPLQTAIVGKALTNGYLHEGIGDNLLSLYEPLFRQQSALEEAQSSVRSLIEANMTFAEHLNTSVYMARPNHSVLDTITGFGTAAQGIASFVDTSWMRDPNPWETQIATMLNTSVGSMYERDNLFAKLIDAENETGRLLHRMEDAGIAGTVTSAATQMASILEAIRGDSEDSLRGFNGIADIVTGYGDFALSQHKWIQEALEAGNSRDADWRIGLLDVTSKFVDRQVTRSSGIESVLAQMEPIDTELYYEPIEKDYDHYESIDRSEEDTDLLVEATSFFTAIPQEIGYTKREDIHVSQEEAFEKSKLVTITELGYGIVDRVLALNKIQEDHFQDVVFKPTSKTFWMIGNLGRFICDDAYKFESMINHMYFLIYENQNGIKKLLGDGDEKKGDVLVRDDAYSCIFRIKDIRTDFEHDIDHGGEKKYEKKRGEIADAYRFYAKKKPTTAREYKQFQIKLYEDVIALIDMFLAVANEEEEK